jgi:transketolase
MTTTTLDIPSLEKTARKLRENIVKMVSVAGSGHCGGSLSAIDMLTYLYFYQMRVDPRNPQWEDRDRFVLSKGHCSPSIYAVLAEKGYFPEETLWTLRDINSKLQGHPDKKKAPGIDMTTGSLGQGLSCALGMAVGGKLDHKDYRVYAMIGDGEAQSGQIWEAAMAASHYKVDNLIIILDDNKLQSDGVTKEIVSLAPLPEKWIAFGFDVYEINGHDFTAIHEAVQQCQTLNGRPKIIIMDTIKGKGVSFMEAKVGWHSGSPTCAQCDQAIEEIRGGSCHE